MAVVGGRRRRRRRRRERRRGRRRQKKELSLVVIQRNPVSVLQLASNDAHMCRLCSGTGDGSGCCLHVPTIGYRVLSHAVSTCEAI